MAAYTAGSLKTVAHAIFSPYGLYVYSTGVAAHTGWPWQCSAEERSINNNHWPAVPAALAAGSGPCLWRPPSVFPDEWCAGPPPARQSWMDRPSTCCRSDIPAMSLDQIRLDNSLVPIQRTANLGWFPRGKWGATARRYPVVVFFLCAVLSCFHTTRCEAYSSFFIFFYDRWILLLLLWTFGRLI